MDSDSNQNNQGISSQYPVPSPQSQSISYWVIGGSSGLIIGIGLAAITNLFSWYQSDKIALAVYQAKPVSESE